MRDSPVLIQAGARLPQIQIENSNGRAHGLDAPEQGSPALLFVRDEALRVARPYIESWAASKADLTVWYGRPIIITETAPVDTPIASATASPDVWVTLGIAPRASALIIADRWGMVYFASETTAFTDLPDSGEVEEWLRYLATQCPECGVIDEPGYGEWAP